MPVILPVVSQVLNGIPVADSDAPGVLVDRPGQLQYGRVLTGSGSSAGWRGLVGWRDEPSAQISDTPRPQASGAYPGDVFGESLTVTYTYLLRGRPDAKTDAINVLEQYMPMDGVERPLVVNDGDGPWMRMARVIGRTVPMDKSYRVGPVECSVQFLCADPRRYAVLSHSGSISLPVSSGGLEYPLAYPLEYGESASGQWLAHVGGAVPTPLVVTYKGPLTNPMLVAADPLWQLGFDLTISDGETLTVDTAAGTVLLNGTADRLYTIRHDSDPLEKCLLPPGDTTLSLTADSGTGSATVSFHDARM